MNNKLKQRIAGLLAGAMALSAVPFAGAADAADTTTNSNLKTIVEKYVDAADGNEISTSIKYAITPESITPQEIADYTYLDYDETVEQVYSHKDLNYIIGYPDGSVRTERNLTRAESATIFYRLFDKEYPDFVRSMSNNTFSDVKSTDWFYKEVETLYNLGIINGTTENTFDPNESITRAEFSVMAARFANLKYSSNAAFKDVQLGHWAYSFINAAAEAGWINGYKDGTFRPENKITRAETMKLVNGMINRSITVEELEKLGVKNPYNDITSAHWAYPQVMEATVKHSGADWHGTDYNDGVFNVIIERYVDTKGNVIAEQIQSPIKADENVKAVPAYMHIGTIRYRTYIYTNGDAIPSIEKHSDKELSFVGDTLSYTAIISNAKEATHAWKNVVVTDEIPELLSFVDGSVYVDGKSSEYTFENGVLTVKVDDIDPGKSVKVTFKATVNEGAYNETIYNTVIAKGDNGTVKDETINDTDEGTYINKGETNPYTKKSVSSETGMVGEKLIYTVKMGNDEKAVYKIEDAVMVDAIPSEMNFVDGSVSVDGKTVSYNYDEKTAVLSVELGDIAPGKEHEVKFAVIPNASAYGKVVKNTAILTGENIPNTEGTDEGVKIGDGKTKPIIEKTANKTEAKVGDKITYTLKASNAELSTVVLENAVIEDVLPVGLDFNYGSVKINGKTSNEFAYDEDTKLLSVNVGTIDIEETVEVKFVCTVNENAYNSVIENLATLKSDNSEPVQDKDDGVVIADGMTDLTVVKSADSAQKKVGDTVNYTVEATNAVGAEVNVRDAVFTDIIPEGLTFIGNVQVDGYSAQYSYDNETKTLTVKLADIAPGMTRKITFDAVVNSSAYGKTIYNTAVVGGSNTPDAEGTDEGITVDAGNADGHIGAKTVNKSTAKVGDTLTYSIKLSNSAVATADWVGMTVTDVIPEGLTFANNVKANGSTTTNYSYNAQTKTLVLTPDAIPAGESVTFEFDVTVNEGTQGKHIVNTAILDDNGDKTQLPDTGVDIDAGETKPMVSKTASKDKVNVGDTFLYTVNVTNGAKATATWQNAVLTDVLPTGLKLMGNVYINNELALHTLSGQALSVLVGDLAPNETAIVTFEVQVLEAAAGQTLVNTAVVKGDNGEGTGTDTGVEVPNGGVKDPSDTTGFYVTKDVDKTLIDLKNANDESKMATFTITVGNNSGETWKNVILKDVLDLTMLEPITKNNVYVDGVLNTKYSLKSNGEFALELGDIASGEKREVKLTVRFLNDAANKTYVNYATATGDNGNATGKSPEIEIVGGGQSIDDLPGVTNIHYQLFAGYADGKWRPNDNISLQEAATVVYRLISNGGNTWLNRGPYTVPTYYFEDGTEYKITEEMAYFISWNVLPADSYQLKNMTNGTDYEINYDITSGGYVRIWPSAAQLNKIIAHATGEQNVVSGTPSRLQFAKTICLLTGRSLNPDTGNYSLHSYSDVSGSAVGIVNEVSHEHKCERDTAGNEYWIN